ncbi:hypothetical protein [Agrilutibacter solisilvae]|uniref:Tetratricopeptide repeat protein n=1 Tax=Agrilutibacter solisilvae TaxID=2763317 RepID=A0A975ARB5_9GAMM|nr:hypothetical protein [Lysobacter solisilvae]QSX77704.1 hypothetical protein I8J32_013285 [Lysobacter solisilvae]
MPDSAGHAPRPSEHDALLSRIIAALVLALLLFALPGLLQVAHAARPVAFVPADGSVVLDRLPGGYMQVVPVHRETPGEAALRAQRLYQLAARTGDARLATRADALLARQPTLQRNAGVRMARAFSAQHRHDFPAALRELDALIAASPRHGEARLARAQIQLVRGNLAAARQDCVALATGIDQDSGLLCVAMLSLRQGRTGVAAQVLDRWLRQDGLDPARRAHALLLRADVAARARDPGADAFYRHAMAASPGDVRVLLPYARFLRDTRRPSRVESLLAAYADHDGLQLQRALAAQEAGAANAATLRQSQARRYALLRALGQTPELRDEAEYLLLLRHDIPGALAVAQRNFRTQRDHEDVQVLARAAQAAGRTEILRNLHDWSAQQGIGATP